MWLCPFHVSERGRQLLDKFFSSYRSAGAWYGDKRGPTYYDCNEFGCTKPRRDRLGRQQCGCKVGWADRHRCSRNRDAPSFQSRARSATGGMECAGIGIAIVAGRAYKLADMALPGDQDPATRQLIRRAVEESFVSGFRVVMIIGTALALEGAGTALTLTGRSKG